MDLLERYTGCLLGLAIGDAIGTTVEFKPRGSFPAVTGITGGGPFHLQAGQWTDDTAMALCLAASLTELGEFSAADQAQRYARWMQHGYMSSTGECFDIGITTRKAIARFLQTGEPFSGPTDANTAGNGCLMRLAPVPMFFRSQRAIAIEMSGQSSRTTHGARHCVEASQLFGGMLWMALTGNSKQDVLLGHQVDNLSSCELTAIAEGHYADKPEHAIVGTGYVVDSLEAALWCFWHTDNYRDAVLKAANLGDDADTTAAICGQLAGAYYGRAGIPAEWQQQIAQAEQIIDLATRLYHQANQADSNQHL